MFKRHEKCLLASTLSMEILLIDLIYRFFNLVAYCEHILKFRLLNLLPLHLKTRIVNPFPLEKFPLKQSRLKLDWSGNAITLQNVKNRRFINSKNQS